MIKRRKSYSSILIIVLLFNVFVSFSYGDFINIYEDRSSQNLSESIVHEKILRFTELGWLSVNVVKVDLDDNNTKLDVLFSQSGLSDKEALSDMAKKSEFNDKIVAAINGDFYDTKDFATIGPIIRDGSLITNTTSNPQFATFNIDKDRNPFLQYWGQENITLENNNTGNITKIDFVNKPYVNGYADRVVLLDKGWGTKSFGKAKHSDIVEMVIKNNKIVEIRENADAVEIPEDGFVIAAVATTKALLLSNFSVGDEVSLRVETNPDINNLDLTIGGGAVIIKDGTIVKNFSLKIPGRHPRTALGITRDKEQLILVTIDGRTSSYIGATQEELAKILLDLGAHDAINLDGGGSTEMMVRDLGDKEPSITNYPSSGFERRIVNGLAVINDSRDTSLKSILLNTDDTNIFVGTSRVLDVKGYDNNYNPIDIEPNDIDWNVTGVDGEFRNNVFYPKTAGQGVITANYKGESAHIIVNILDNPVKLEITPSKIFVDTNSQVNLSAEAVNDEGYSAKINVKNLIWSIPDGLGEIDDNVFISSGKPGNNIMTATLKNINAYIQIANGYDEVVLNNFEKLSGEFLSFPNEVTGSFELSSNKKEGNSSGKLNYDFSQTNATRAAYIVFNNSGLIMDKKPEKLGMWVYGNRGNNHWLRGKLVDANGVEFSIDFSRDIDWNDWKLVEANIPKEAVAPLKLERVYIVEIDPMVRDSGYIYIDDITAFYKTGFTKDLPDAGSIIIDKRNAPSELKGDNSFKFMAHGKVSGIDTLLDNLVMNKIGDLANEFEKSVFSNEIDATLKEKIKSPPVVIGSGYSMEKYKNSTFIKLDNTNGGIRATDYKQWIWLLENIKKIDSKNVFFLFPQPLSFNDQLEEKLFMDVLNGLRDKEADVWVLSGNNPGQFQVKVNEGIRFVKLKSYPVDNNIDIYNDLKYIVFTVNDGYVTYEIKNMY